jgi:hypothetical protein
MIKACDDQVYGPARKTFSAVFIYCFILWLAQYIVPPSSHAADATVSLLSRWSLDEADYLNLARSKYALPVSTR